MSRWWLMALVLFPLALGGAVLFVMSSGTKNSDPIEMTAEAEVERFTRIPEAELEKPVQAAGEIIANKDDQESGETEIVPAVLPRPPLRDREQDPAANGFVLERLVRLKIADLTGRESEIHRAERVKIRGNRVAIEDETFGRRLIIRPDLGLAWVIDQVDRTYSEVTFEAAPGAAPRSSRSSGRPSPASTDPPTRAPSRTPSCGWVNCPPTCRFRSRRRNGPRKSPDASPSGARSASAKRSSTSM
jgi:hypothetical protein